MVINIIIGVSFDGMFEGFVKGINVGEILIEKVFLMNLDEYVVKCDVFFIVYIYMY